MFDGMMIFKLDISKLSKNIAKHYLLNCLFECRFTMSFGVKS